VWCVWCVCVVCVWCVCVWCVRVCVVCGVCVCFCGALVWSSQNARYEPKIILVIYSDEFRTLMF